MTRKAMADKQAQYQVLVDNFLFFDVKKRAFPQTEGKRAFCAVWGQRSLSDDMNRLGMAPRAERPTSE